MYVDIDAVFETNIETTDESAKWKEFRSVKNFH